MKKLRGLYKKHRSNAKARGVDFLLSFEEWLSIWEESGKLDQRGPRKGQYVMSRFRDEGPYAVGNVRICAVEENHIEKWKNPVIGERLRELNRERSRSAAFRTFTSKRLVGNTFAVGLVHSEEFREKQRLRMVGNQNTLGRKASAETRRKISEGTRKALSERKRTTS